MRSEVNTTGNGHRSIFDPLTINPKIEELIRGFNLPRWVLSNRDGSSRKCEVCGDKLSNISLRTITLCLNPQHMGDIQIEVLCRGCSSNYFIHFRKECVSKDDFIAVISGTRPKNDPVLLSSIKPSENNLSDIIVEEAKKSLNNPVSVSNKRPGE